MNRFDEESVLTLTDLKEYTIGLAAQWDNYIITYGMVVGLCGDMGSGKTTFVRHLCDYWGLQAEVRSPSYVLENRYNNAQITISHWDLFRVDEVPLELVEPVQCRELRLIEWIDKHNLQSECDVVLEFKYPKSHALEYGRYIYCKYNTIINY
jgi:tRNA threonylcarbamoyl adenosine modification protein YjeE